MIGDDEIGHAPAHGARRQRHEGRRVQHRGQFVQELVEAGKVTPHVDTVLRFAEIKQALALSESGRARGKIVLAIAD